MSQQAQIDALEHLLMAVLKINGMSLNMHKAFDEAESSIMSSDGPPGAEQKTQAREYLAHLRSPYVPKSRK